MLRCLISTLSVGTFALCGAAAAQEFPTRPVRIVTAAVGGTTDLVARAIAQGLTASLGQQVIVDNRPTGIIPGELRALAITTPKPSQLAPGPPTVAESGLAGYQSTASAGMFAPVKTPARLITLLNLEIVKALSKQEVKDLLARDGTEVVGSSPQEFAASINAEMASMGKVIKAAGIRAE